MDLSKPLQRLLSIATPDGTTHAGLLKYERLPTFCFLCAPKEDIDVKTMPYGSWTGGVDYVASDQLVSMDLTRTDNHTGCIQNAFPLEHTGGIISTISQHTLSSTADKESAVRAPLKDITPFVPTLHLTPKKRLTQDIALGADLSLTSSGLKKKKILPAEVAWQPR